MAAAAAVNHRLAAGRRISSPLAVSRASTRMTFPSTAGTGIPKEMDATAPAVYSPIPGRPSSAS